MRISSGPSISGDLLKWRANRETCCTYAICVFSARFRTCMSSVMRCRRDVIRDSFAKWDVLQAATQYFRKNGVLKVQLKNRAQIAAVLPSVLLLPKSREAG